LNAKPKLIFIQFQTLQEERSPIELEVKGTIPAYASGTLYRTGPASYKVERGSGQKTLTRDHWFDGFGHTYRFQIVALTNESDKVRVFYNSRRANDRARDIVKQTGRFNFITFGQARDPCVGIFGKVSRLQL